MVAFAGEVGTGENESVEETETSGVRNGSVEECVGTGMRGRISPGL